MKVALCFSGQPRSVAIVYPIIYENIIKPYNPDVYIHSWIGDHIIGKKPVAAGGHVASNNIPHNIREIILKLYKPKDYIFEPQIEFDEKNYNDRKMPSIRPKYSISQRYSVMKSIDMALSGGYDAIIRMRFDWKIHTKIDIDKLSLDQLTAPNDSIHMLYLPNGGILQGVNDQFGIGNPHVMQAYGQMYNRIDEIYNGHGIPFVDELMLSYYMQHLNGIALNKIPIEYTITRFDNNNWTEYRDKEYIE